MTRHLVLLLAVLPSVAAAQAPGRVVYATRDAAYLDQGAARGLTAGAELEVRREGRVVGACRVDAVAPHGARCVGSGLARGDEVRLPAPPPTPEAPKARKAVRPVPDGAAEAIAAADYPKVPFAGPRVAASGRFRPVEARVSHVSWQTVAEPGYHLERLDVAAYGVPLGGWDLRADARASLLGWSSRPATARFRPDAPVQLYVWETAVSRRPAEGLTFTVGRARPRHAPGAHLVDGGQAGWRAGALEVGIYGGGLPELVTLVPTVDQWTAGAYYAHALGADALLVRHEGRVAFSRVAIDPSRLDAEERVDVQVGRRAWVGGQARVALAGDAVASPTLEALSVAGRVAPAEAVSLSGGWRTLSADAADVDGYLAPPGAPGSRHADAAVRWAALEGLEVGLVGDWAVLDGAESVDRWSVGPELALPGLFGPRGSLGLGYREAFGWWGGRDAWVQSSFAPADRLQVLVRLSYFATEMAAATGAPWQEGGLYSHVDGALSDWLDLRVSVLGRASNVGGGVRAGASLGGRF